MKFHAQRHKTALGDFFLNATRMGFIHNQHEAKGWLNKAGVGIEEELKKYIVERLKSMKNTNNQQRGSLPKEQWDRSDGWSAALDAAIETIDQV